MVMDSARFWEKGYPLSNVNCSDGVAAIKATAKNAGSIPATRLFEYFRLPEILPNFGVTETLTEPAGFFRFGADVVCFGRSAVTPRSAVNGNLMDSLSRVRYTSRQAVLPFDLNQVTDNLRYERYMVDSSWHERIQNSPIRKVYYLLRPLLSVAVRKHIQKLYLKDWESIAFPTWPVDRTVDSLFQETLKIAMTAAGIDRLPFIWFWPNGHNAAAMVTHDVETATGRDFSGGLMDIDDAYKLKSSFQVVPEERYEVPADFLQSIRSRGFEIGVHGLNHDGNLFSDRELYLQRAQKINHYAKEFGSIGFRSPSMYRNVDWLSELDFSYDMSLPGSGRMEPQRGGCCTVMPFFLPGGMTELPLTTTQDYSLFHIMGDYSTNLWQKQIRIITETHGLMTILIHPDYVTSGRAQDSYKELLELLSRVRSDNNVWMPLPREVDRWWRERSQMHLVGEGKNWRIEGTGCERARVAYASLDSDRLVYEIQ